jgi:hypothetical protein
MPLDTTLNSSSSILIPSLRVLLGLPVEHCLRVSPAKFCSHSCLPIPCSGIGFHGPSNITFGNLYKKVYYHHHHLNHHPNIMITIIVIIIIIHCMVLKMKMRVLLCQSLTNVFNSSNILQNLDIYILHSVVFTGK